MNKDTLLQLLKQQVQYAVGLNGKIGVEATRRDACNAANATLQLLETFFGLDPAEVLESLDI